MADFDFGELDKAVSSLMGKVGDDKVTLPDPTEPKNLDIHTTLGDDEQPSFDNIEKAAGNIGALAVEDREEETNDIIEDRPVDSARAEESEELEVPDRTTKSGVKRPGVGRFNDVMHKSSDMRSVKVPERSDSAGEVELKSELPSRRNASMISDINSPKGRLIQPVNSDIKDTEDTKTDEVSDESSETPTLEVVADGTVETHDEPSDEKVIEPPTPASSPFLPDAKVEKRPLGGDSIDTAGTDGGQVGGDLASLDENASIMDSMHGSDVKPEVDINLPEANIGTSQIDADYEQSTELAVLESQVLEEPKPAEKPKSIQEVESADTGNKNNLHDAKKSHTDGSADNLDEKTREKILGAKRKPTGMSFVGIMSIVVAVLIVSIVLSYLLFLR